MENTMHNAKIFSPFEYYKFSSHQSEVNQNDVTVCNLERLKLSIKLISNIYWKIEKITMTIGF